MHGFACIVKQSQFGRVDALHLGFVDIIKEKKEAYRKRRGVQQRKKNDKGTYFARGAQTIPAKELLIGPQTQPLQHTPRRVLSRPIDRERTRRFGRSERNDLTDLKSTNAHFPGLLILCTAAKSKKRTRSQDCLLSSRPSLNGSASFLLAVRSSESTARCP